MTTDRFATLTTPLSDDEDGLRFTALRGREEVSQCFDFIIDALSTDAEIATNDILGQPIGLAVATNRDDPDALRFFHGIADSLRFCGLEEEGLYRYAIGVRPMLWQLSKTHDNRIFQDMSVQDIVSDVLDAGGVSDYAWEINVSLPPRVYCVQYGETDLDFVQRLLEHEGIFYYFRFEDGKHTVVFCDALTTLAPAEGADEIAFHADTGNIFDGPGYITRFSRTDRVVTGSASQTDYDFEKPSADLMTVAENPKDTIGDRRETYHYPGRYIDHGRGDDLTAIRNFEDQSTAHQIHARSTASLPAVGNLFSLTDYPREAENIEFALLSASYAIWDGDYSGRDARPLTRDDPPEGNGFEAEYRLVPSDITYRPPRITPRPVMKGPQTAVVVGPSGEEIFTDEYSRVKVQFHWDRQGGKDENSSCFVRVSSVWAGSGWGFIQIPRIGQEVIVDFLEGDPDQPIITGRVYNAEQMPPYGLPGSATQSGWKSNSSPGGGGWNELRFEDKAGSEEVYFQAQKDHNELVKNDESRTIGHDFAEDVGNDATQSVGNDRTESVGNNKSTSVGVDRTVDIGSNDTETVGSNRSLSVGADETISIGANSTEDIGVNHTQTVGSNQSVTVGSNQTVTVSLARVDSVGVSETRNVGAAQTNAIGATRDVTVGAAQSHSVGASDSWDVGAGQTISVGADQGITVGGNYTLSAGGDSSVTVGKNSTMSIAEGMTVTVGKDLAITVTDSIALVCGDAKLMMKKDGTIRIEGKDLTLKGSGNIGVKADSNVTIKGSKIAQN